MIKKNFFAGLLVMTPFAVTLWILGWVFQTLWGLQDWVPTEWSPASFFDSQIVISLVGFGVMIALLSLIVLGISLLGWVSKQILGQKVIDFFSEAIIQKIPVIRSVYSALDQLLKTLASREGGQQFSRVVYVEYPRRDMWSLAFVTGHFRGFEDGRSYLNLFIPTTPNPTSGFYLIVEENQARDSNLSVEEAFKSLLSLGIAQPVKSGGSFGHVRKDHFDQS